MKSAEKALLSTSRDDNVVRHYGDIVQSVRTKQSLAAGSE
jgi:hypothetical protein